MIYQRGEELLMNADCSSEMPGTLTSTRLPQSPLWMSKSLPLCILL